MNRTLIISAFFIALALLFGCNSNNKTYYQLTMIDSLTYKNLPDSAYNNLQKIKNYIKTDRDKAYYGLLLTRVMYMRYKPLKSDSLISSSIEYYEKTGETDKLADAYLTKGKNLYYRGYIKQAILYAKECEQLVKSTDNLSLKNELYIFLSAVNSKNDECKMSLKYSQKALQIAETNDKETWKISAFYRMAVVYAKLGNTDSACYYIYRCIPYLKYLYRFPKDRAMIMDNIGYLYKDRDPQLALKYLNMALATCPSVDTYDNLAQIYYKQGQRDKADSLWSKALRTKDVEKRCEIVEAMLRQKAITADTEKALKLSEWLIGLKDSVNKKRQENNVKELQMEYDAQAAELAQQAHIRTLRWIICLFVVIILASTAMCWLYIRNRKLKSHAKQLEQIRKVRQYQDAISDLEQRNDEAESSIKNMVKSDNDSKRKIAQLKSKLEKLQAQNAEDEQKAYLLYQTAMQGLSIKDWKKAEYQAFINHYAKIDLAYLTMLDDYQELTPREKAYLILQHEGKDDDTIKDMMNMSASTLRTMKSRIKNKKCEQEIEI